MNKNKRRHPIRLLLRGIGALAGLFALYVIGAIVHATVTDYRPPETEALPPVRSVPPAPIADSTLRFLIWNIGYGGLGAHSDFFYEDEGSLVSGDSDIRPPKDTAAAYLSGIRQLIRTHPADFYLLQEVDRDSKRSWHRDQLEAIADVLPDYHADYAANYRVKRVPLPVLEPWHVYGKVEGGLATFSRYEPDVATRIQLPGNYGWPKRVFQLDRCVAYHEYPTVSGRKLIVMNIHNSAFDKGGKLKKQQLAYIRALAQKAYADGQNYVVIGGDWNQNPPYFRPNAYAGTYVVRTAIPIPDDSFPADWRWIFDATTPTNRSTVDPYVPGQTPVTTIDFFLISPNVRATGIRTIPTHFAWSDHQPVLMTVKLE